MPAAALEHLPPQGGCPAAPAAMVAKPIAGPVANGKPHRSETMPLANGGDAASNGHEHGGEADSLPSAALVSAQQLQEEEEERLREEAVSWAFPAEAVGGVDKRDVGTPDAWVARHAELVRLTGRHPFNCEAPLPRLMEYGFLTPVALHYVRNHGYVPRGDWATWRVEVGGAVRRPCALSMDDLAAMPSRVLPVSLVCAGNRRKEENMVKQTIGFNWGAAAVSTSVWRGVRLCDVLRRAGVLPKSAGALHVCFEGAESLPGGGGSKYGTSLRVDVAMDPACDVLLAYEQNGARLEPDHGFPVRMIIPGYIGGRMVKWLTRITVTGSESDNYYHFHDNRVLPSHVDAERATAEGWWYKPDYIINELNVNSAITTPAHGEVLPVSCLSSDSQYTLKGYAYSGGGRKVIRVEVSLDGGSAWQHCDIECNERPTVYGKYWCWVFWSIRVDVMRFLQATEICVRAWDAAMNTQPGQLTWNVMGMMNNSWFRVKLHPVNLHGGGIGLTFEHPTRPGNETGGWMVKKVEEDKAAAAAAAKPMAKSASLPGLVAASAGAAARQIPMSEVKLHDSEKSPWIVVHGKVYDCTKFLEDHPGGAESILINAGTDATDEFDAIHSAKAKAMLQDYYIGELVLEQELDNGAALELAQNGTQELTVKDLESVSPAIKVAPVATEAAPLVALDPKRRIPFVLKEVEKLSHDVRRFRFALPSEKHVLGLPVGKHMFLSATVGGKFLMRAYTPTSSDGDAGYFDLVVKIYFSGISPHFPDGGLFTQHLESLKVGDTIDVKGPVGHIHYQGRGKLLVSNKPRTARRLAMVAGGSGITPMYQILQAVCKDPEDETEIWLLFANKSAGDILLRDDLDRWAAANHRLHVWYTVNTPPQGEPWPFSTGRMDEAMVREHLPPGGPDALALLCGPPGMIQFACLPNLQKNGYDADHILTF
eukprot:SM000054S18122  [mRNA]  locus=s54:728439:731848:+ [translate_table: standard]